MASTSAGSPSIGISRGQVSMGRRRSPGSRNGRRYSAISSSESRRRRSVGSTSSTKTLRSSTIDSPASERMPWTTRRAASGNSAHVSGRTNASMYAAPATWPRWRLAQSNPRADPQSCTTNVTRSVAPIASSRPSIKRRCSTKR